MLILPPYSRREDEQMRSSLSFRGLRNNLKEIITGFSKSAQEKNHSLSLQDFRDSQSDVMSGAAGLNNGDVIIADLDYNAIIGFDTIIF